LDDFIRAEAARLRANDGPPSDRQAWTQRQTALRQALLTALGPLPATPGPLQPRIVGTLTRPDYRIEKLVFQSQPKVWVTGSVYVPTALKGKVPAVLVVHGHWAWARRDPVVQARCLGLVKLGFLVLAIDAFGAGERHTAPAKGTYHGSLYGATLWPTGQTLAGLQVYDNRRAIDYLLSRDEVDGQNIGITGASGGGNQSMYAGALDDRIRAVVPVCSVGNYQAYLRAACCLCEVVPGALRFTEEGDVLGLVAPRALMILHAAKDAFQFSPEQAAKSVSRAQSIFRVQASDPAALVHRVFDSGHDYNQPMREAMYGFMTRWLKGQGLGEPIAEPAHTLESPDDLACVPERPAGWLTLPQYAGERGQALVATANANRPTHPEEWQATAVFWRSRLRKLLGEPAAWPKPTAEFGPAEMSEGVTTVSALLASEGDLSLPFVLRTGVTKAKPAACILVHWDGPDAALKLPLARELVRVGWAVYALELRGTGSGAPADAPIRGALDHNVAEHAVWIGRPLLGQWVADVVVLARFLAQQPRLDATRTAVVGVGSASLIALAAGALHDDVLHSVVALNGPTTLVTSEPYGLNRLGLFAPGLLTVGDVPHLAALCAPRKLAIVSGTTPANQPQFQKAIRTAFAFTEQVYRVQRGPLLLEGEMRVEDLAAAL
jgi:cephalosporin-C deacetylase-like acetyl esterase